MKTFDPNTGRFTASLKPDLITYWVVYSVLGEGRYRVHVAYSHRLEINKKIKENEHRKYRI